MIRKKQWIFIGYDKERELNGQKIIDFPVEIKINDYIDEKSALNAAKGILKRNNYFLKSVQEWEENHLPAQLQNEVLAKWNKFMDKELSDD